MFFVAALNSGKLGISAADLKVAMDFESSANPASIYTEDIMSAEFARALDLHVVEINFARYLFLVEFIITSRKGIKHLPESISSLTFLVRLNLTRNALTEVIYLTTCDSVDTRFHS